MKKRTIQQNKEIKALALFKYGKNGELCRLRELVKTTHPQYAIYPVGTTFNKDILKENRAKIVNVKIIII